ncbi:hypothetical protein BKA67DRAFT_658272 [Truncatella angustata]|uniref:DUF1772-domain-containing protein n=1 Tax=Truncatella angustata TaxID=152316 RepID=A0A9P8UKT1_9PEZI|nr:uncharacterized protein BKA67DRAFT_658272 [Truncatella angustata]KAH6653933.1 hypothetical protein BKA67DRAFT_658272 [Truncatella angustata]KAH8198032.1 hypothetical protein TruAng_007807 [Truncatella angustata]
MVSITPEAVVGTTIALSYILLGNAITQSFMGVPALLVDFPHPTSPDHAARVRLLGRQWPVFWAVGNVFFRPISTFGIFGYGYTAYAAASSGNYRLGDWRLYAVSAACHLITVVHSALNMQPINVKIDALKEPKGPGVDAARAESYARKWISYNTVRLVMPLVAGTVALWQTLISL